MQTLTEIKQLLEERGLAPKHSLGQNFLVDHQRIRALADDAGVGAGDLVLEVGPGTGALTTEMLERGAQVIACELDSGLAGLLRETLGEQYAEQFTLIEGDCLEKKTQLNTEVMRTVGDRAFKLVANLPYGAGTPLMVTLATKHANCMGMWVTIQREVAQRLRAEPGSRDFGELSVLVQARWAVKRVANLPPGCFWPQPKVTSEMVSLRRLDEPLVDDYGALGALCRVLFTKRRKMLRAILGSGFAFPAGIDGGARPEQLSVAQFVELAVVYERARS